MIKEDKELLLKDLAARLPYGVICHYNCVAEYDTMVIQKANCVNKLEGIIPFNGQIRYMVGGDKVNALSGDIKPYLRPISSMTEEEKKVVNNLIYNKEGIWSSPVPIWVINESDIEEYIDFCNLHHLDWRGLIIKGLALEAPEEMYKKEE